MLTRSYDPETKLLTVVETIHGFMDTKISHWYRDMGNRLVSSFGREGDTPDREMTANDWAWAIKHHLPGAAREAAGGDNPQAKALLKQWLKELGE